MAGPAPDPDVGRASGSAKKTFLFSTDWKEPASATWNQGSE
jgi:hypothetical protein